MLFSVLSVPSVVNYFPCAVAISHQPAAHIAINRLVVAVWSMNVADIAVSGVGDETSEDFVEQDFERLGVADFRDDLVDLAALLQLVGDFLGFAIRTLSGHLDLALKIFAGDLDVVLFGDRVNDQVALQAFFDFDFDVFGQLGEFFDVLAFFLGL